MKFKTVTGILLIVLSIAGLIYWESVGREKFTTVEVLAAAVPIKEGTTVTSSDFKAVNVMADSKPRGALDPAEAQTLQGMTARVSVSENQPVEARFFADRDETLKSGSSVFVLPKEWIFSRPAMLRAGDRVALYVMPEKEKLGAYKIAYVRDSAEQAVMGDGEEGSDILARDMSTGIISSVEIICTPQDYFAVYDRAFKIPSPGEEKSEDQEEGPVQSGEYDMYGCDEDSGEDEVKPFLVLVLEEEK